MTLAPAISVPPRRPATTPVTLGVTDPDAIATFLKGVPLDDAFWRRLHHRCDHCQETGTTVCGALWRVSLADDCTDLYYLHTGRCLSAYKRAHALRSVEGRLPLTPPAVPAPATSATWRTRTVTDPTDGPLTTLYSPDGRPTAYAAGVDDAALRRVADRLNGRTPAVGAVQR